jgi:hypothetical protein
MANWKKVLVSGSSIEVAKDRSIWLSVEVEAFFFNTHSLVFSKVSKIAILVSLSQCKFGFKSRTIISLKR